MASDIFDDTTRQKTSSLPPHQDGGRISGYEEAVLDKPLQTGLIDEAKPIVRDAGGSDGGRYGS
jgi:hypothetical protein